jgi:hypothetical protein
VCECVSEYVRVRLSLSLSLSLSRSLSLSLSLSVPEYVRESVCLPTNSKHLRCCRLVRRIQTMSITMSIWSIQCC